MTKNWSKELIVTFIVFSALAFLSYQYWRVPAYLPGAPFVHTFSQMLWLPISLIPESFLDSIQPTGCLDICLFPSGTQILLYLASPLIILFGLSLACVLISDKFGKLTTFKKYGTRVTILLIIVVLFSFYKESLCIKSFEKGLSRNGFLREDDWNRTYLQNTGIVIVHHDGKAKNYQDYFGVKTVYSKQIDLVQVPIGQEFRYACKLKEYPLIRTAMPLYSSILNVWRQYVDKNYK